VGTKWDPEISEGKVPFSKAREREDRLFVNIVDSPKEDE
jgi:hypothetical protein